MTARRFTVLAGLALAGLPACSAEVQGRLVLAIQTDMAMPKDIDRIRIEVTYEKTGAYAYQMDFTKLGEDDAIKLPATLAFVAPADPSEAIRIRVLAGRGPEEATRLLREAVTTVPSDRVATLRIPIEFLCEGTAGPERDPMGQIKRDPSGRVIIKDDCPSGLTCSAGTCVPEEIPSETLPDYDARDIFGGGTGNGDGSCFDSIRCFEQAAEAEIDFATFESDPTVCRASAAADVNVALSTQGAGLCGKTGCYVALDAESDSGWRVGEPGFIRLPVAVCAQVQSGKLVGVVTAPTGACPQKRVSLPVCGPWSSSGVGQFTPTDPEAPVLLAPGQVSPVSLALVPGMIFWTNSGTFDAGGAPNKDGTVKRITLGGGDAGPLATGQSSPHDIVADEVRRFVLWTNADSGEIMWSPFDPPDMDSAAKPLINAGLLQPEGIAVSSKTVYWTDLADNSVHMAETSENGADLLGPGPPPYAELPGAGASKFPRDIAAATNAVCWTYEDKLMSSDGAVACYLDNAVSVVVGTGMQTPRAITMSVDESGAATAVYWANFAPASEGERGGGIYRVLFADGGAGEYEEMAKEDYPGGVAVDRGGQTLYWTSRSRGTVMSLAPGGGQAEVRVSEQNNPGAIAVDEEAIYWINEGAAEPSGGASRGAILKVRK